MPVRTQHLVPMGVAALLSAWLAGCGDTTAPQPVVQIVATSPVALVGTVGTEVEPTPSVQAVDEQGRPMAGVAVTFKVVSGGGTISGGTVSTDASGAAALTRWTLGSVAGTQTLTAGVGGASEIVFTALAFAGPVAQLESSGGNNQLAGVGQPLEQPLVAVATDAFGNPVAGAKVTFAVTGGGGTIASEPIVTDEAGKAAAAPWTLGAEAGLQHVTAVSGAAQATYQAYAAAPPGELEGQIAFISWDDEFLNFAVANADGSGVTALPTPFFPYAVAWSPDGSLIGFAGFTDHADESAPRGIGVMTADGANLQWLTNPLNAHSLTWSPEGDLIAFPDELGIASVSTADGRVGVLLQRPGATQPSWSPDGQQLVFVAGADLHLVHAEGTGGTRLTDAGVTDRPALLYSSPAWSPDGSLIAFCHGDASTQVRIGVMTPDGSILGDLAAAGAWENGWCPAGSLAWSPDGTGIAFTFEAGIPSERSVRYVSLDRSRQSTIVTNAQSPTWRP